MPGNMIDVELADKYPFSHTLSPVYQKCLDAYVRLRRSLPAAVFFESNTRSLRRQDRGRHSAEQRKKSAAQNR